ncbi:hypothetical protein ERX46_04105 [Brumimicrobium glaciale]|uniref:Uncharacterized protein n=1 Tax=Brumimicrobium glaciale TaxID=200475 RepID=A0A4Q4KMJ7_9FLAO|nr:hypothetical protein [Brumimicrobium glaciale]RYM34565.1 hypothetical protein ERX46_04105 [Brumimicrobium glaciale]
MAKEITIRIDERSKFGQIVLQMIKMGVSEEKGIQLISAPNKTTIESIENINSKKELTKTENHSDLMNKLNT